jgi:hypothetical protein
LEGESEGYIYVGGVREFEEEKIIIRIGRDIYWESSLE